MDWEEIWHLIDSQKYFLLYAPRQTGKTTALLEMMYALNKEARYTTLYINIEGTPSACNDVEAIKPILSYSTGTPTHREIKKFGKVRSLNKNANFSIWGC